MNNNQRLFLDIHAIQTLPPSNINRDDTGSPKSAQYGGIRRARVSSQSWKRAIRNYFIDKGEIKNVGVRTLEVVEFVAKKILELDNGKSEEEAIKLAKDALEGAGLKLKDNKTKALFFLGDTQGRNLAKAALEGENDKEVLKNILKNNQAIDIALFGRMLADDPSLNEDASSQVAHAISTHGVQSDFDFFTAVDDLQGEEQSGAGMLGTIEFNSSTLYRYANVAVHDFYRQIEDKESVAAALKLYVEAFINSLPTGKVNSFANQTVPQGVLIVLRKDRPVNLVSAFEKPVSSTKGYVEQSLEKLMEEYKKTQKFVEEPEFSIVLTMDDFNGKEEVQEAKSIKDLLETLNGQLEKFIQEM
ncbi:type I-E CRISPR-associated protein Cas7/Cse4/CasC [Peptoniphilus sp. KCTC 25270]|uniref:type I-E CRISPR-associated protein Cas7/Cse4/CasC n=1 Tax=Peptoniphilus sp. KCTC 25270 TaxID=2897414 RepID=UPI001E498C27|nr:type I-E CRISPR-associated protein Cas7/Cse4/CasC [Peptoniphilus sp. KCTC 25270]MCD1147300.1 type I-E CRISPR-associated protein Cas7/Cse4/CasC [Peptoniphilus sp. KCTC 25270]